LAVKKGHIYAKNASEYVWRPGSVRTGWWGLSASSDSLTTMGAYF